MILSHSDNLSRALQKSDISAVEGQAIAAMSVKTLLSVRSDQCFELFWGKTTKKAEDLGIGDLACHVKGKPLGDLKLAVWRVIVSQQLLKITINLFTLKLWT